MGYTHYFQQKREVTTEEWQKIVADVRKLVDASPVTICNGSGDIGSSAVFEDEFLAFNGEENDDGDAHETFWLPRNDRDFNFCKTQYKPYDLIVVASLCAVDAIVPDAYDIGSDGDESEWAEGLEFARNTLGNPSIALPDRIRD